MIIPTFVSIILLSLFSVSARQHSTRSHHVHRRQETIAQAQNLPTGAIDGCTEWFSVKDGDYCYIVANKVGITLESFYSLNPQVDSKCSNLWSGYDYCISDTGSVESTPALTGSAASVSSASLASHNSVFASSLAKAPETTTLVNSRVIPTTSSVVVETSSTYVAPAPTTSSVVEKPSSTYVAPAPSTTSTPPPAPKTTTSSAAAVATSPPAISVGGLLSSAGVTGFLGTNSNAIVSWFRTNFAGDDTNGHSWCGRPYSNDDLGFAPDVTTMLNNFGGDYVAAGVAYCGLEAIFTTPDGRTATLYLADGFDSKWVRTPSSVDVIIGAFPLLFGSSTNNKNDVVQGATWKFTGNRNPEYAFKGYGH